MPIYEIEEADGRVYELEAPDWDTAANAYKQYSASQPAQPQPQAQQANKLLGVFDAPNKESWGTQGMSGVSEGLSYAAGLPVDAYQAWRNASDWAGEKLKEVTGDKDAYHNPIPEIPEGGLPFSSEQLQGGLKDMGLIQPESDDPNKRVFRRGLSFATEAMTGKGLLAGGKYVDDAWGFGKSLLAEGALGGSAGVAGGVVKENTDNPYAVIAADLTGGFAPSAVSAAFSKGFRSTMGATSKNLDEIKETVSDFDAIGASPTIAQATDSKPAAIIEKGVREFYFGNSSFAKNADNTKKAIEDIVSKHIDKLGGTGATRQRA